MAKKQEQPPVAPGDENTTGNAVDVAAVNERLKELLAEQAAKLAAHEKVAERTMVSVAGRTAVVAFGVRVDGEIFSPKELASRPDILAHLVKIGSDAIQFID